MILINGVEKNQLSCKDRGLHYGDGFFETLAVRNGRLLNWDYHWARMQHARDRLFFPDLNHDVIFSEIQKLKKDYNDIVIKLIITRGEGNRGYAISDVSVSRILIRYPWPNFNKHNETNGIELFSCKTRLAHQPLLAGIKHLNRLENVLARHEWQDDNYAEGIVSCQAGNIIEGTMSNVFIVKDNMLKTPELSNCGVKGVIREKIIKIAEMQKIALSECQMTHHDVNDADEMFMCNSLVGIWPVKKIASKQFAIGAGKNPVTQLLQQQIYLP